MKSWQKTALVSLAVPVFSSKQLDFTSCSFLLAWRFCYAAFSVVFNFALQFISASRKSP